MIKRQIQFLNNMLKSSHYVMNFTWDTKIITFSKQNTLNCFIKSVISRYLQTLQPKKTKLLILYISHDTVNVFPDKS